MIVEDKNMEDQLILVDENDNEIGTADKLTVHLKGLRHRAFSVFIFDGSTHRILMQKRAFRKYHSGGLWSNSCCSHTIIGKNMVESVFDTIQLELGVSRTSVASIHYKMIDDILIHCGCFSYYADLGELSENEIDHVFLLNISENISLKRNPDEIDELKWIELIELENLVKINPERFTAWFLQAFALAKNSMKLN